MTDSRFFWHEKCFVDTQRESVCPVGGWLEVCAPLKMSFNEALEYGGG